MNNINTLISIVGPTAIGKTHLGITLAKHYKTHIISADSRQFYKELQIGTAVPTPKELEQVPHEFIQHKSVTEPYSVGDFENDALNKLNDLFKTTNTIVMVGGSGLYIKAVTNGLDNFPKISTQTRENLNKRLKQEGLDSLTTLLKEVDKTRYNNIDLNNPHRVIRALEVYIESGKPYSYFINKPKTQRTFKSIYVGLYAERNIIYDRIDKRVDTMISEGLIEEVKRLKQYRNLNALNTVGYKELFNYLDGIWTLEKAIEEIKKNTRRFAKRQLTWFRKNKNIAWFNYDTPAKTIINYIERHNSDAI